MNGQTGKTVEKIPICQVYLIKPQCILSQSLGDVFHKIQTSSSERTEKNFHFVFHTNKTI